MTLTKEIVNSLGHISDEALDRVTSDASAWLDRRWFRLLDSIDLPHLLKGEASFHYVVVRHGEEPVAICPFIVTRSKSIYFHYSLEKFFFLSWQDELLRMNPESERWIRSLSSLVSAYRQFARVMGTGVEGWVLAVSPLTYRGGIAHAEGTAEDAERIRELTISALQEVARSERVPLCFYGLEEEDKDLRQQLVREKFEELFLFFDTYIDMSFKDLDGYLAQFKSEPRRRFKQEMRQPEKLGYRFEVLTDFEHLSAEFERFYEATYSKYGEEHFRHPASFWTQFSQKGAPMMEAVVAYRGDEPKGFVTLLKKGNLLWAYRAGRTSEGEKENPIYFNLVFYEPLKRALELGSSRFWISPGAWDVKRRRGARAHAIYSYIWFPKRVSRALLLPYLSFFSRTSYAQMSKAVEPAGIKES
jgi:predicted N-acyltransferase